MGIAYRGGMPYGPDVERVGSVIAASALKPGVSVDRVKIAEAIGARDKTPRFYAVVNAWRRHLWEKHSIIVEWADHELKVFGAAEEFEGAQTGVRRKGRQFIRATPTPGRYGTFSAEVREV